jgi:hypothetical protein
MHILHVTSTRYLRGTQKRIENPLTIKPIYLLNVDTTVGTIYRSRSYLKT